MGCRLIGLQHSYSWCSEETKCSDWPVSRLYQTRVNLALEHPHPALSPFPRNVVAESVSGHCLGQKIKTDYQKLLLIKIHDLTRVEMFN